MSRGGAGRASLQQGLDKDVYQIVRKYLDATSTESSLKLKPHQVYEYIKGSNSSLKRRPKKQLEDSIERVLLVMQEDEEDDSQDDEMAEIEGEFADAGNGEDPAPASLDFMNRSIVSGWKKEEKKEGGAKEKSRKREGPKGSERESKRMKKTAEQKIDTSPPSGVSLKDLGGVDNIKKQLKKHLLMPLLHHEEYAERDITIPRGILLHGPPGCGKTVICKAFAADLGVPFIEISGPSIVRGISGESEQRLREYFDRAKEVAPSLIFIDEIDVIAPKRESAQSQMEQRIVAQLLICMDGLSKESNDGKPVIVLAATNRPDSLDYALRRGERFDTEINMGVPNEASREHILKALLRRSRLADDVDFSALAKRTAGFVGADLKSLVSQAGAYSMEKYLEALEKQAMEAEMEVDVDQTSTSNADKLSEVDLSIWRLTRRLKDKTMPRPPGFENTALKMEDFEAVLPTIVPSSKREGFATVPDTTWQDVGALAGIRDKLQMAIIKPIKNPQRYKAFGISAPTGVLLWGPPGCGKTLLAKAVAAESKANFISVKGPELLNKYVGESERALRQVFMRARSSVPCIIFMDEFDALVPKRSSDLHEASARVVNTLLTELDGLSAREGIYLIAATNRPDMIDGAMLRPGRLETLLYVQLPEPQERVEIMRALILQRGGAVSPDLASLAVRDECTNFSGADLGSLLRKAGENALRRDADRVEEVDVLTAAKDIKPSVGNIEHYEQLRQRFEKLL